MERILQFISELRRRSVFKVAAAYCVTAWLLVQVAAIVLPTFEAPSWTMKAFLFVMASGFPIALLCAWAFDLTPDGWTRTLRAHRPASPDPPATDGEHLARAAPHAHSSDSASSLKRPAWIAAGVAGLIMIGLLGWLYQNPGPGRTPSCRPSVSRGGRRSRQHRDLFRRAPRNAEQPVDAARPVPGGALGGSRQ